MIIQNLDNNTLSDLFSVIFYSPLDFTREEQDQRLNDFLREENLTFKEIYNDYLEAEEEGPDQPAEDRRVDS